MRRLTILVAALVAAAAALVACGGDDATAGDPHVRAERALDAFVADLEADPPTIEALPARIRAYVQAHPRFVGAAVALLTPVGHVTYSPYVYRTGGELVEKDLVTTEPEIDRAAWLAVPRDTREAVWSDPYFDAGGAEIWMETRSVPLLRDGVVYAVATTDLPVAPPPD